jgi:hypothetical protein
MVKDLPDATRVVFDDERAVANAGVLLPAILADRLGIEGLVDEAVDLGDRSGSANPGRRVMSLVSAMAWGRTALMTVTCCARVRPARCSAWGRGAVDVGDVSSCVHFRARPPARPGTR